MTQKQLGEKCGMYESQIRKYELGTANPKLGTIIKIADALGVDVAEILTEMGVVRKMAAIKITVKITQTEGLSLEELLKEVWELRKEHPDVKINVEVSR